MNKEEEEMLNQYYAGNSHPLAEWFEDQPVIKKFMAFCAYEYCQGEIHLVEDARQNMWVHLQELPVNLRKQKFKIGRGTLAGAFVVRIKGFLFNCIRHEEFHDELEDRFLSFMGSNIKDIKPFDEEAHTDDYEEFEDPANEFTTAEILLSLMDGFIPFENSDNPEVIHILSEEEEFLHFIQKLKEGYSFKEAFDILVKEGYLDKDDKYVNFRARLDFRLEKLLKDDD